MCTRSRAMACYQYITPPRPARAAQRFLIAPCLRSLISPVVLAPFSRLRPSPYDLAFRCLPGEHIPVRGGSRN
jgi:hypothetical protein